MDIQSGQIGRIQALAREIRASSQRAGFSFDAFLAGRRLRFFFAEEGLYHYARSTFLNVASASSQPAEAVFYMDTGPVEARDFSETGAPVSVSLRGGGLRGLYSPPANRFWLYDERAKAGYERLAPAMGETPVSIGHSFFKTLRVWAETVNLRLLHGAAVGASGRGALIAGMGGRGKTSLALGCLLEGMDYVTDDYFLLESHPARRALPIYAIVALNPDMEPRFPELSGSLLQRNPHRGNRGTFSIAAYRDRVLPGMGLDILVYPQISNRETPRVQRMDAGRAVMQIALSSAKQAGEGRNPAYIKELLQALSGMPAFGIELCDRPRQNARLLKELLEGF